MGNDVTTGRARASDHAASPGQRESGPSGSTKGLETKAGLLEAAEQILLEEGMQALTFRRIGAVASINPTLVTYYFGGIPGLLVELYQANLEPMQAECEPIFEPGGAAGSLRDVLRIWLNSMLRPAAFTQGGPALVVLDEIAGHGDPNLRSDLLASMRELSGRVQAAIHPFVPELEERELRARLRFLSAAALGPLPRSRSVEQDPDQRPLDSIEYLLAFAQAALASPGHKPRKK